jgi:hypothetical protein
MVKSLCAIRPLLDAYRGDKDKVLPEFLRLDKRGNLTAAAGDRMQLLRSGLTNCAKHSESHTRGACSATKPLKETP